MAMGSQNKNFLIFSDYFDIENNKKIKWKRTPCNWLEISENFEYIFFSSKLLVSRYINNN